MRTVEDGVSLSPVWGWVQLETRRPLVVHRCTARQAEGTRDRHHRFYFVGVAPVEEADGRDTKLPWRTRSLHTFVVSLCQIWEMLLLVVAHADRARRSRCCKSSTHLDEREALTFKEKK